MLGAEKEVTILELNERIAERRKAAGLTQEQLGALVGVTRQAVSKWESGQAVPDALMMAQICRALHASADYLLLGIEPEADGATEAEPELPGVCPCCGRTAGGTVCPVCGYPIPVVPERGQKYALLAKRLFLTMDDSKRTAIYADLERYCGITGEYAAMYLDQLQEFGTMVVLRRDLSDSAVQWIAAHLDRSLFQLVIVADEGGPDEMLLLKSKALDPAPSARTENQGLGFWGTVGAVVLALLVLLILLSFF